ncbi:ATP-binding protein [Dolichospermum sp. UHCC 0684]|uniref:ATP-binding protein n=1 Tax=unclassified Dolichospermum TaxID=2622029 RepID=UPI001447B3A6|nr:MULTISPECIES: ATP-binding protein [unclassified Dolichospermum]MEA5529972.1 ATP-binding protein [Dolichospermum sp. UHCC 0684]MTJ34341.1 ATP-binding protein [Dolichospermum sp. UHCC 0260]
MRLDFVEYCQDKDLPSEWRLEGCQLGNVNLIVGKNASGKSRILGAINFLSGLLSGDKILRPDGVSGEWIVTFDADKEKEEKKVYILKVDNGQVVKESFTIGSKTYLDRTESGTGKVWADKEGKDIDFQTPINGVAAFKRRDSIQHPVFDKIYDWAFSLRYYKFGTDLGKNRLAFVNYNSKNIDLKDTDKIVEIFNLGKENFGNYFIKLIQSDMLFVGYNISEIDTETPASILFSDKGDEIPMQNLLQYIYVQESDLKDKTEQVLMSQGMFRALSIIIQINYSLLSKKPSCILIDDIGEGLDFERASAMIKLLISKAQTGLVQLIMTTNDRFIMNGVPLEYWSVIERKSGLAKLHNIHNSKEIFDDFKFTGLNNFDFFATQFYIEGFGNEENIEE